MLNGLNVCYESSCSNVDNTSNVDVSILEDHFQGYHISISNLLCFKHYCVVMTCIFVVLTRHMHAYYIGFCRRRGAKF